MDDRSTATDGESTADGPRATSLRDHAQLERRLRSLLDRARAVEPRDLVEPWQAFERGLRAHLAAEEEEVFPIYAVEHPSAVRALRLEHAEIRALLDVAAFGAEPHTSDTARLRMLDDLASRLSEHAAHEDAVYASVELASPNLWQRVRERFRASLRGAGE